MYRIKLGNNNKDHLKWTTKDSKNCEIIKDEKKKKKMNECNRVKEKQYIRRWKEYKDKKKILKETKILKAIHILIDGYKKKHECTVIK